MTEKKATVDVSAVLDEFDTSVDSESDAVFSDDEGGAAVEWTTLPAEREFFASPYDPPVKTLVDEIATKELVVRPTFQRYAVWDSIRKSKFVESILLNIPIPTLFFAEDDDKSKVVVDGQQRLSALKEYLENQFALKGLEVLIPLNGKKFEELTERQQKIIRNRTLRCLVISAKSDSEIRFQVFERLNQGGVALNAQEVRHCVYRGPLNDLLHELVKDAAWMRAIGLAKPHQRMTDCELVLRFFALRNALPNYKPPLKNLLTDYMGEHRRAEPIEIEQLREAFGKAVAPIIAVFGKLSFRRFFKTKDGASITMDRSINRAVFDAQMLVMEGMDAGWAATNKEAILKQYVKLCLDDGEFADTVSKATADKARLETRLRKWRDALKSIGAVLPFESRIP